MFPADGGEQPPAVPGTPNPLPAQTFDTIPFTPPQHRTFNAAYATGKRRCTVGPGSHPPRSARLLKRIAYGGGYRAVSLSDGAHQRVSGIT